MQAGRDRNQIMGLMMVAEQVGICRCELAEANLKLLEYGIDRTVPVQGHDA